MPSVLRKKAGRKLVDGGRSVQASAEPMSSLTEEKDARACSARQRAFTSAVAAEANSGWLRLRIHAAGGAYDAYSADP